MSEMNGDADNRMDKKTLRLKEHAGKYQFYACPPSDPAIKTAANKPSIITHTSS